MKKSFILFIALFSFQLLMAQGNGHKEEKGNKEKTEKVKEHAGAHGAGGTNSATKTPGWAKNLPTNVERSFRSEYPHASNVVWSKSRGNWTATFRNGVWTSTATYHANGDRMDTRTPIPRTKSPGNIWDEILRRYPQSNPKEVVKVEQPKNPTLYKVTVEENGRKKTIVVDETGKQVKNPKL